MKWHEQALSPPKGEGQEMTAVQYHKYIAMRDELIDEQRQEIAKLKMQINKLKQHITALDLRLRIT